MTQLHSSGGKLQRGSAKGRPNIGRPFRTIEIARPQLDQHLSRAVPILSVCLLASAVCGQASFETIERQRPATKGALNQPRRCQPFIYCSGSRHNIQERQTNRFTSIIRNDTATSEAYCLLARVYCHSNLRKLKALRSGAPF